MSTTVQRPVGVTILAILAIIGGVFGVIANLGAVGIGGATLSGAAIIVGLVGLAVAILYLAFGIGALQLQPWAWTLGVVGAMVSLILNIVDLIISVSLGSSVGIVSEIVGIIIAAAILYYLRSASVRAAFGRA